MRAVIFDLDGTLVHSAPDIHAAANHALAGLGRAPLDLATVTSFIGNGVEVLMQRCLEVSGGASAAQQAEALERLLEYYGRNRATLTRPFPGVVDCLARLRGRGVALAVCTNKPQAAAEALCDDLDLTPHFQAIVGAAPDRPKKPDPAALHLCIERLGVRANESLYVGDSTVDHDTAARAGIAFRLFTGGYLNGVLADLPAGARFGDWRAPGF